MKTSKAVESSTYMVSLETRPPLWIVAQLAMRPFAAGWTQFHTMKQGHGPQIR